MDDLTLLRDFRAERDDGDPRAREAAWLALEERLAPAPAAAPRAPRSRRRGFLAVGGATALAAIVAAILLLSSGPATQPAAAEVLHETAAIAASGDGVPGPLAGPGQYYFTKFKELSFEGWVPGGVTANAPITSQAGGFSALIPKQTDLWMSPEGSNRTRTTMGTPQFLSDAEQSRWEAAGSPLPIGFDTRHEDVRALEETGGGRLLQSSRGVLDTERPSGGAGAGSEVFFPDLSKLPTDPRELRLAIQGGDAPGIGDGSGKPRGMTETIGDLEGLLGPGSPNAGPALRAAAFDALAEIPGFELDRDARDLAGRDGYSIGHEIGNGERQEIIVDPATSTVLGERIVLVDPGQEPQWKGYEAGLVTRDVAYLEAKVVDSTREPAE